MAAKCANCHGPFPANHENCPAAQPQATPDSQPQSQLLTDAPNQRKRGASGCLKDGKIAKGSRQSEHTTAYKDTFNTAKLFGK
ncbi:hypothetical protein CNMCM5793_005089 [Aspergillus hiratsukae]|uniref:Uncharacterized protein n=1 Tax=Aspergillus hiratsukae TaxID=1194566 RepID=A0A8H6V2D5_9EURO|nr:hypothetical protein CNMCM5793_005089 [Aspergillus hiratsukae]KAF7172814.1 hypothetical protein CNMCM6106_006933 [Aspergillus hiratsukae]